MKNRYFQNENGSHLKKTWSSIVLSFFEMNRLDQRNPVFRGFGNPFFEVREMNRLD